MGLCNACGADLIAEDRFCANCGTQATETGDTRAASIPRPTSLTSAAIPAIWAESCKSLAIWLEGLLLLAGLIGLGMIPSAYERLTVRLDYSNGTISYFEALTHITEASKSGWANFSQLLVFIIFIVFIIWTNRSYRNLVHFGVTRYPKSTGWAIGGWFIPFYNAIVEKEIIDNVWRASAPAPIEPNWNQREREKYFTVGWVLFFIGLALGTLAGLDSGLSAVADFSRADFTFTVVEVPTRVYVIGLLSSIATPIGQLATAYGIRNISTRYETKRVAIAGQYLKRS